MPDVPKKPTRSVFLPEAVAMAQAASGGSVEEAHARIRQARATGMLRAVWAPMPAASFYCQSKNAHTPPPVSPPPPQPAAPAPASLLAGLLGIGAPAALKPEAPGPVALPPAAPR